MKVSDHVYSGVWWDYETSTYVLTLTGAWSAALQAAIAIFVTFVGSATWTILVALMYHTFFTPMGASPSTPFVFPQIRGILDQRRVLIRNSSSGFSAFYNMCSLFCAWAPAKGMPRQVLSRLKCILPIGIIGLVHWVAWIIGGVIVSFLWTSPYVTDLVKLKDTRCGFIDSHAFSNSSLKNIWFGETIEAADSADTYVKECYMNDSPQTTRCSLFSKPRLSFASHSTTCPDGFNNLCLTENSACGGGGFDTMCIPTNSIPYQMDTGYLSSLEDLGINTAADDAILFRKTTTCSPVNTQNFTRGAYSEARQNMTLWPARTMFNRFYLGPVKPHKFTYQFANWATNFASNFILGSVGYMQSMSNSWEPNPRFFNKTLEQADVAVFFLNAGPLKFTGHNTDPFFTTGSMYEIDGKDGVRRFWLPGYYTNVMTCQDQYQLCKDTEDRCSPLSGLMQLGKVLPDLELSETQMAIGKIILNLGSSISTQMAVANRGARALLASYSVGEDLQLLGVPHNQWRLEAAHWFSISLARLQQGILDFVTGPRDPRFQRYVLPPSSKAMQKLCSNQKIRAPSNFVNFNFSGTVAVLVIGLLLIALSEFTDAILDRVFVTLQFDRRRLQWIVDTPCQLQRLAYKAAGLGIWRQADKALPVWHLDEAECSLHLDIRDKQEPVLGQASKIEFNPK